MRKEILYNQLKKLFFTSVFCISLNHAQECSKLYFNEEALLKHIEALSSDAFEGRLTGSRGGLKAKKYIINQFYSLNVKPFKEYGYEQKFSFNKGRKTYSGTNVLGYIKGTCNPKKFIVISAHYDHVGIQNGKIYNGADDNASGVSALFSFAEYLKKYPPKHSVILAAFDAEELGIKGSAYFVNNLTPSERKIMVNLNMDMISRSEKNELYVSGANLYDSFKEAICCFKSSKIKLISGHDGFDGKDDWTYASDHRDFHKRGIPFLYFGVEDHKDYHEPTDDFENINQEFYIEAVRMIISVFNKIDDY